MGEGEVMSTAPSDKEDRDQFVTRNHFKEHDHVDRYPEHHTVNNISHHCPGERVRALGSTLSDPDRQPRLLRPRPAGPASEGRPYCQPRRGGRQDSLRSSKVTGYFEKRFAITARTRPDGKLK